MGTRTAAGTGRDREQGRTQDRNGDGSGDINDSSSGDGNGVEDGDGNGDGIGEGGGEANKRKKPHKSCRRDVGNGGMWKEKKRRQERVSSVAANRDNLENSKGSGGKHKVPKA